MKKYKYTIEAYDTTDGYGNVPPVRIKEIVVRLFAMSEERALEEAKKIAPEREVYKIVSIEETGLEIVQK